MKILQVASGDFFSTYGGGQVYVRNIVDEMVRRHEDVSVISFVGHHAGVECKDYGGITLYEIGPGQDEEIGKVMDVLRPDVVHAHSHKALVCGIGKSKGIPVVVTAHHGGIVCPAGTLLDCADAICRRQVTHRNCLRCCLRNTRTGVYWHPFMRLLPEKAYIRLGDFLGKVPFVPFITPVGSAARGIAGKREEWRKIADLCTTMIAPSHVMGEAMTLRGLDKDKLRVVPHGIPMPESVMPFPPVDGVSLKFFYVGRICYVKGIHVLLEAFSGLKEKDVEMHLVGGSGNKGERRYMRSLMRRYAADGRILWHGKVPPTKVYETIADFHVSSSSSYLESFGLNIAESLAMGKPVLATRCGGAEMQIKDGVNGWLVPTGNVEALRTRMEDIIRHKDRLAAMAETCRRSVTSLTEHCDKLLKIYSEII